MKKLPLIALSLCALVLLVPATAMAGKGDKAGKAEKKAKRQLAALYDTNANGVIDPAEREGIEKAYEGNKAGGLKTFDINNDGKFDNTEISEIKSKSKKGGKKKDK